MPAAEPGGAAPYFSDWQLARVKAETIGCAGDWPQFVFGRHAQDVPEDATASHLLAQAQLALLNAILRALGHESVAQLASAAHSPAGGPLNSGVLVQLASPTAHLGLFIDSALLDAALPPIPRNSPLIERAQAIGSARLTLHLQLPLTSLSIEAVQGIKAGDILRGEAALAHPMQLAIDRNVVVAKGFLARQQRQLAVQLVPQRSTEV